MIKLFGKKKGDKLCGGCGKPLGSDRFCRNCGMSAKKAKYEPYDKYEPYNEVMQLVYGPPPVEFKHKCGSCGNSWTSSEIEHYCPDCGGEVSSKAERDPFLF